MSEDEACSSRHSRSKSFRTVPSGPILQDDDPFLQRGTWKSTHVCRTRYREESPSIEWDNNSYVVRRFQVTSKGDFLNTGDSLRLRSRSNTNISSAKSYNESCEVQPCSLVRRVLMLGGVGVGKTALVEQFMSSDTANAYEASQDEEIEKSVSVLLEKNEYEIVFSDTPIPPDLPKDDVEIQRTHAFLVVYSCTDKTSFNKAKDILSGLKSKGILKNKAVILVGNKCDLARSKEVNSEDGKSLACKYNCKFIETSAGINHNVDELLAGIVNQIRLKESKKSSAETNERSSSPKPSFFNWLLSKPEGHTKSKSCENLMVL